MMKFFVRQYRSPFNYEQKYPFVVLTTDDWNDYKIAETLFHAELYIKEGEYINLGDIKIMTLKHVKTRNVILSEFDILDESYCSLGQTLDFYSKLSKQAEEIYVPFLKGLRDCATDHKIAEKFQNEEIFISSLLRFSEAEKAMKEAKKYFGDNTEEEKVLEFSFKYKIDEATSPHEVSLDFKRNIIPYRINAFVGKNATGKTKILTELAVHISGIKKNRDNFLPARPSFSKVIAISYSAFDELYKPFESGEPKDEKKEDTEFFSYKYCGLRNKDGVLSLDQLEEQFIQSFEIIKERRREEAWKKIMQNVFEEDHLILIENISERRVTGSIKNLLSSGQNILLSTITDVIAYIEEDSILLFDEPEIHLHPNAIANFMRMFYEILEDFNSFAVISTHSPIIIQEIPSRYIRIFSRVMTTPLIEHPFNECFGENISSITNDIFDVREHESNYKTIFKLMAKRYSKDEIISHFEDELSYNALTYLNSIFLMEKE